jgi:hypothetical protein
MKCFIVLKTMAFRQQDWKCCSGEVRSCGDGESNAMTILSLAAWSDCLAVDEEQCVLPNSAHTGGSQYGPIPETCQLVWPSSGP